MVICNFKNLHPYLESKYYTVIKTEELGRNYTVPYDEELVNLTYGPLGIPGVRGVQGQHIEVKVCICKITRRLHKILISRSHYFQSYNSDLFYLKYTYNDFGYTIFTKKYDTTLSLKQYCFNWDMELIEYSDDGSNEWKKSWDLEFPFECIEREFKEVVSGEGYI
jgi:hypothetical protein